MPDADEQVGVLDGAVDVDLAVHARHAEVQRVILGKGADAEQRGDDRDAGVLGEERRSSLALPRMMPWPARISGRSASRDEPGCLEQRSAGRRSGTGRPRARRRRRPRRLRDALVLHVLRDVDEHRARTAPPAPRRMPSRIVSARVLMSSTSTLHFVIGSVTPMMSVSWNASRPIIGAGHLAGDGDDRRIVHVRRGEAGDEVGGARVPRWRCTRRPARGAGIAVGGVRGRLLMAHQDVAQRRETPAARDRTA